ncbi:MAG: hypothetical protein M3R50_13100 [Bacteroidota bacterium]|nr:hypothetical protein [Bacteroidota bacterium]
MQVFISPAYTTSTLNKRNITSTSFTLVDTLHGITLFFIFIIIAATAYSLKLVKANKIEKASRFDMITAQLLIFLYVVLNLYFIFTSKG